MIGLCAADAHQVLDCQRIHADDAVDAARKLGAHAIRNQVVDCNLSYLYISGGGSAEPDVLLANRLTLAQPRERAKQHDRDSSTINREGSGVIITGAEKQRVMVAQAQQLVLYQVAVIGAGGAVLRLKDLVKLIEHKDAAAAEIRTYRPKDRRYLIGSTPSLGRECGRVDDVDVVGAVFSPQRSPDLSLAAAGRPRKQGDARAALKVVVDDHGGG